MIELGKVGGEILVSVSFRPGPGSFLLWSLAVLALAKYLVS